MMLVQRNVDALTAATHCDTGIAFTALDRSSTWMGKIGIVTTVLVVCTEVLIGDTLCIQPLLNGLFGGITGMIAAQRDRYTRL